MDSVKPLVYMSVFFNKQYITLLKLLLTSVKLYSKYENLTFLVITQKDFVDDITNVSNQIGIPLKIHTLEAEDVFQASVSKCRIFEYSEINNYSHILYLDTDIIIKGDLTKLVTNINEEKLYGMETCGLGHPENCGTFFTENVPAINAGVLLFKNTSKIRQTMNDCILFMINFKNSGKQMPCCLEQPFINYFFYKENLLDTKYLQNFVILCNKTFNPENSKNYTVYHFNDPNDKLIQIRNYLLFLQKKSVNNTFLNNPKYVWGNGYIQIKSDNTLITTWGKGTYYWKDSNVIKATFCNYEHNIYFENSFTTFLSVRNGDCDIVKGNLISLVPKYITSFFNEGYLKSNIISGQSNVQLEITNKNNIKFTKTVESQHSNCWFGYELDEGIWQLNVDILSDRPIDFPFLKTRDFFIVQPIEANKLTSITLTINISNTLLYFIFENVITVNFFNIRLYKTPLCEIMETCGTDKGGNILTSWHSYTQYYYSIFNKMQNEPLRIFELGLGTNNINIPNNMGSNGKPGASLYGWRKFFPNSELFGADIDTDILFSNEKISTFYCDQTNPDSIQKLWKTPKLEEDFDIIIEDGLHCFSANVCFFENSIKKLKENGYYIIEDIKHSEKHLFYPKINFWKKTYPNLDFQLLEIPCNLNNHDNNILVIHKTEKYAEKQAMKIHVVMYSEGEPFTTSKKNTLESVINHTNHTVIIHDYNFERIKNCSWFEQIKDLPNIHKIGRRDGYYCVYKIFCALEVYLKMDNNDVLYYLDSSQYYQDGFTENIDKLCSIALEKGFIAGSIGNDIKHKDFSLCYKINVWKKVYPECTTDILERPHILASWFLLTKNNTNTQFMNDWVKWSMYTDSEFKEPLITEHLTVDQSIFNMLVYKYNLHVFYDKNRGHLINKDKNSVLKIINESLNRDKFFVKINTVKM